LRPKAGRQAGSWSISVSENAELLVAMEFSRADGRTITYAERFFTFLAYENFETYGQAL
jgi:hypothetical protein